jgi:hypothetical protein
MIGLRTILLSTHVAGLALGLGTAAFLDLRMLPALRRRPLAAADLALLEAGGRAVAAGLALLWISGIGLVYLAWRADPGFLGNPKLHAKLAIVAVLTLNGLALHALVLPMLRAGVGRPALDALDPARCAVVLGCGAVSAVSWAAAFLLGMARELNHVVPAASILQAYALALLLAWAGAGLLMRPGGGRGASRVLPGRRLPLTAKR